MFWDAVIVRAAAAVPAMTAAWVSAAGYLRPGKRS
jgi:hypothetical protein